MKKKVDSADATGKEEPATEPVKEHWQITADAINAVGIVVGFVMAAVVLMPPAIGSRISSRTSEAGLQQ